ncbi:B3/B4 domain-containing protein [Halalkalibacter akibai]|uniref:B3/B4 tRNA-binding domain-containing protein n=1 Tax=Halalkalibacter akibai (strain ATCC 43226 / DSM 21942 / CIP 109018 / JCM 9157 / 1139) TaxID=1236973 RepID=W4QWE7_HALA3|nr:phenylalanine--tRNA ligase beta subunit-related protein [Halalkalibacter akibai]GAE36242.1 hypothetical protein JCM9157_3401 [Halalkalibacter akibai JCM 9157]
MVNIKIDSNITVPNFKMGVILYHNIAIDDSPQMLKGRLQFFQETLRMELETKELTNYEGIAEWRQIFKLLKMNPGRYRPSHEALLRRIKKGDNLPLVHSAVDLNTFFSLEYCIPLGIYDLDHIQGDVILRLGKEEDSYEGVNGRVNDMNEKLISSDNLGAFGSPIVDSTRTKVTTNTTSALQLFYLRPSMTQAEATQLLEAAGKMFTQIHGGDFEQSVVERT